MPVLLPGGTSQRHVLSSKFAQLCASEGNPSLRPSSKRDVERLPLAIGPTMIVSKQLFYSQQCANFSAWIMQQEQAPNAGLENSSSAGCVVMHKQEQDVVTGTRLTPSAQLVVDSKTSAGCGSDVGVDADSCNR
jgi:hypothetical protein